MRPIDGDSAVQQIRKFVGCHKGCSENFYYGRGCKACAWSEIIGIVENAPTIEQYGTWIPVSSGKLPNTEKPYKAVLLQLKNSMIAGYTNKAGQWFVDTGDGYCEELNEKPIAWMPLPEPYREEKKDEKDS